MYMVWFGISSNAVLQFHYSASVPVSTAQLASFRKNKQTPDNLSMMNRFPEPSDSPSPYSQHWLSQKCVRLLKLAPKHPKVPQSQIILQGNTDVQFVYL